MAKPLYNMHYLVKNMGTTLLLLASWLTELGHLMYGLPDLYDTDTSNGDSAGVRIF